MSSETLSIATEFVQTSVTHYLYYMQATHNDFDDVDEESAALTPELSEHFILFGHQRSAMVQTWLRDPKPSVVAFAELAHLFGLTADDLALLLLAAGPSLHPNLEALYTQAHPPAHGLATAGLIAAMLALGDEAVYQRLLSRCTWAMPLRRLGLLGTPDPVAFGQLGAQRRLSVSERIIAYLQAYPDKTPSVDEALSCFTSRKGSPTTGDNPQDMAGKGTLTLETLGLGVDVYETLIETARSKRFPLVLDGDNPCGKDRAALALGDALGCSLLDVELGALLDGDFPQVHRRLMLLERERRLGGDLIVARADSMETPPPPAVLQALRTALMSGSCVLSCSRGAAWLNTLTMGWPTLTIPLPCEVRRTEMWRSALSTVRSAPEGEMVEAIARRYHLTEAQIHNAASEARRLSRLHKGKLAMSDLDQACRSQFAHTLGDLAQPMPTTLFDKGDLILPPEEESKFDELLAFAIHKDEVFREWGFAQNHPYGRGLSVLFYGPPGTGKTMASMIIAQTLGLDLFRVELSRIVSRYVGETEKNLARVFDEAEKGRVVLLFDEADALFTKRTQVKSSVDRYANLEVAYLLQRMENFEGISVLTTNAEQHLDDAFKRRIRYKIHFPFPDPETRGRLWSSVLPEQTPRHPDIPFALLGQYFELSGGVIKASALRAAFYAMQDGSPIGLTHLVRAATAECREAGALVRDTHPRPLAEALKREEVRG